MRIMRLCIAITIGVLMLGVVLSGIPSAEEGSSGKHEGSMMKDEAGMKAKSMACEGEHLKMMLQTKEDRECMVDGILADEDTRNILMKKIAADPELRKEVMHEFDVMMKKAHGGMDIMKPEAQGHGEGSASKK